MVSRKLYLTGGVGSRHLAEAFGKPYELPNELAYCETCAAIASIMWCWRMLLITGEARFADLAERTLYNAVLSGVSLDGSLYFYVNPLADNGEPENLHRGGPSRKPWHNVACCPPNVMRLVASLGHYAVSQDAGGLQIHQYGDARITADLPTGSTVTLSMAGEYPWDGRVRLSVVQATGDTWTLSLRIPGWCESASVRVNGETVDATPSAGGYLEIERAWQAGDTVELDLPMPPRLTEGHPWIESTRGCVAIERGPLVYCLEQADQEALVYDLEIDPAAPLTSTWQPDLLDGVTTVHGSGFKIDRSAWEGRLYRSYDAAASTSSKESVALTAVPVYAWANRGPNAMKIWIPLG
jgi:DUF1680 family protein